MILMIQQLNYQVLFQIDQNFQYYDRQQWQNKSSRNNQHIDE